MTVALRPLDMLHIDAKVAADASLLHVELLPRSPLAALGEGFLRRVYYRALPLAGAVAVRVAYVDHLPAGFIVVTQDADAVRRAMMERYLLVLRNLACAVLASPARLGAVIRLNRLRKAKNGDGAGEILSFGVLPGYRLTAGATHLSEALYSSGLELLYVAGTRTVRAVVDRDNTEARLFYAARAWRTDGEGDPAWPVRTVRLSKNLEPGNVPR